VVHTGVSDMESFTAEVDEAALVADRLAIDTIRTLSMDAVQRANSGHPGTPMALAPVIYTLWSRFLTFDPSRPEWINRDRFVLSVGHASMLLYAILHLAGVRDEEGREAVGIEDITRFRQLGSRAPGHPEFGHTVGVETTTGPLGAGCSNAVGMAIASRWLGSYFNRPGFSLFDFDVYALCGDGDLMEGVSGEAASLAGHLKLSNLCWIYDANKISIEGSTDLSFTESVAERFHAYGWNTLKVSDANDLEALSLALQGFKSEPDRPTLIIVNSVIGWGSPKAGDAKAHGEPLGAEAIREAKAHYGWDAKEAFAVPAAGREALRRALVARGGTARERWDASLEDYRRAFPVAAAELEVFATGLKPAGWDDAIPSYAEDVSGLATRDASGQVLNAIAGRIPWLLGGSADLAPSTKTWITNAPSLQASSPGGRNIHFGVREHAMGSIVNGLSLCGLPAYAATFLVFADYMRAPIRLAAMMRIPSIFVFTHDSISVGEDGPTHQPIEHLAALRAIPGLDVIRPADANETAEAWRCALGAKAYPTALVLSRQSLPTLNRSRYAAATGLHRGGYVLASAENPEIILMATGSEVELAVAAYERLTSDGVNVRVVSMPSWHRFERQPADYRDQVLPPSVRRRLAIEQASDFGWHKYVGLEGRTVTMSGFGASAPAGVLQERFGFTVEHVVGIAQDMMLEP
jgi:transketolase